jgi:hypothetical protein
MPGYICIKIGVDLGFAKRGGGIKCSEQRKVKASCAIYVDGVSNRPAGEVKVSFPSFFSLFLSVSSALKMILHLEKKSEDKEECAFSTPIPPDPPQ